MKIAIVGGSGYIARQIFDRISHIKGIEQIYKIGRAPDDDMFLDLNSPEQFAYNELEKMDYIIFTAAVSSPDKCKNNFDESWKVNVSGTEFFIEGALKRGCKVIFFSSDTVFGADIGTPFDEESETNATTTYGKMKKAVEDCFTGNSHFKAIRLSYVVSATDKFVKYCRGCIERNEEAEIFHPFYRNCITVSDVAGIVCWLIENWDSYQPDYINAAGIELVSRVRIADEINRLSGYKLKYKIVYPDENFFADRDKVIQMQSKYIKKYEMIETGNFTEKLAKEMKGVNYGN